MLQAYRSLPCSIYFSLDCQVLQNFPTGALCTDGYLCLTYHLLVTLLLVAPDYSSFGLGFPASVAYGSSSYSWLQERGHLSLAGPSLFHVFSPSLLIFHHLDSFCASQLFVMLRPRLEVTYLGPRMLHEVTFLLQPCVCFPAPISVLMHVVLTCVY